MKQSIVYLFIFLLKDNCFNILLLFLLFSVKPQHESAIGTLFFYGQVIFHWTCMPHLLYLFIYQWTLRLSPYLGYWKGCHNEHRGAYVFAFFWKIPRSGIAQLYSSSIFNFLRKLYAILHSGYVNLQSYQQHTRVLFSPHPYWHYFLSFK